MKRWRDGIIEIGPGVFQVPGQYWTPHSSLLCGETTIAIVEPAWEERFPRLEGRLCALGLIAEDVDLVLNTHEHLGHMGAARFFQGTRCWRPIAWRRPGLP